MARACGLMSMADTCACGSSWDSVMAMQPLPVPMSNMSGDENPDAFSSRMIHSVNSSVSGRGTRTPGATEKVRPQKSVCPKTYCTGPSHADVDWREAETGLQYKAGYGACLTGRVGHAEAVEDIIERSVHLCDGFVGQK